MAKFELNVYKGEAVEKTYKASYCPWALYTEAADVQDNLKSMTGRDIIMSLEKIMLSLFEGLTKEEMQRTDSTEVMSLFLQLVSGNVGEGSKAIKNA